MNDKPSAAPPLSGRSVALRVAPWLVLDCAGSGCGFLSLSSKGGGRTSSKSGSSFSSLSGSAGGASSSKGISWSAWSAVGRLQDGHRRRNGTDDMERSSIWAKSSSSKDLSVDPVHNIRFKSLMCTVVEIPSWSGS